MTKRFPINSILFNQLYGFLTICLYGWFFFEQILSYNISPYYLPFAFVITWQLLFILFSLFPNHKIFNFIKSLLLISNAFVFYFIYAYHTPVDKIMFMNAMQTDSAEVKELLNKQLFYFIILLGILPCILINTLQIHPSPNKRIFKSLCISICSMLIVGGISYKSTNILLHKFKYLQNYISPINYIIGGSQALIEHFKPRPPLQSISEDVDTLPTPNKPNLIVFILGETTRAANFSLNGYHRPTNQPLDAYLNEIIYYPNTLACGTSTAVAVPCIFSKDPQKTFKTGSEVYTENILDIFKKAGYKIWWRDNDGGCKDVCNRVIYDEPCQNKSCIDNVLFNNLKEKIANNKDNQLIILHTRGSHGPAYHLRYEEDSNIYSPICTKNALWECPQEELINVYDNTNLYVSKFIAQTIEILKLLQNEFNPILFYTSDHGESLGENKVYLHAAPYNTAPAEQKEVPMLVWLPQDNNLNLQHKCLKTDITGKSHDNIFHSLLGISGISSTYYQKDLDIFSKCNKNQ